MKIFSIATALSIAFIMTACRASRNDISALAAITDETALGRLPVGTELKFKTEVNLLPRTGSTYLVTPDDNLVGLWIKISYAHADDDRSISPNVVFLVEGVQNGWFPWGNQVEITAKSPGGFAIEIEVRPGTGSLTRTPTGDLIGGMVRVRDLRTVMEVKPSPTRPIE